MKAIGLEGRARRLSQARCSSDASAQQHRRCLRWRHGSEPRWGCHRAPGRCRFSAADLGFRRLARPFGGVWLLPRRPAGDVAWRRELCPICAHAWATAFRRRSCQRVDGHRKAPMSAASPNLVRELGRGRSQVLVDAVHGAYFDGRRVEAVPAHAGGYPGHRCLLARSRHPHGGSTELNCDDLSAPRGSAGTNAR
jgi:hypothetical protein